MTGCAKEPAEVLSSISETYYQVKLTPENCGLTNDDSSAAKTVTLNPDSSSSIEYSLEIGAPCYLHKTFHEFVMKPGAYIKSIDSQYVVDRLIIDFYGAKGTNFAVYSNSEGAGTALEYHESTIEPEDSSDGIVYEYAINGNEWCIKNDTEFNKPAFYSIIVVFLA